MKSTLHLHLSGTPLVEKSVSVAYGNYVALPLAKLTPGQFRRAKKLISDVLYDMEEKDGMEQAGSCPRSFHPVNSYYVSL